MLLTKGQRRRKVYVLGRSVFAGDLSSTRDRSAISKIVSQNRQHFAEAIQESNESSVLDILSNLLREGIFESELKAKLRFPGLFQPSPERSLQHEISEQAAEQSEHDALRVATYERHALIPVDDGELVSDSRFVGDDAAAGQSQQVTEPLHNRPSLFPIYLSYVSQHALLNFLQKLLEGSCYDFTARWIPELLSKHAWSCAQAVELGKWIDLLPREFARIPEEATTVQTAAMLRRTLEETIKIRHAAVHRLPTNAQEISRMFLKALNLVRVLRDTLRTLKLEILEQNLIATSKDLELHKNCIESDLDQQLNSIKSRHAELDTMEAQAKSAALCQDKDETHRISCMFEKSIKHIDSVDESILSKLSTTEDENEASTDDEFHDS